MTIASMELEEAPDNNDLSQGETQFQSVSPCRSPRLHDNNNITTPRYNTRAHRAAHTT